MHPIESQPRSTHPTHPTALWLETIPPPPRFTNPPDKHFDQHVWRAGVLLAIAGWCWIAAPIVAQDPPVQKTTTSKDNPSKDNTSRTGTPKNNNPKDAVDRLNSKSLSSLRQAIQRFAASRQEPRRSSPLRDVRANLHVHSELSHDSRGTLDEIVAAARRAGTEVLLFTEHPSDDKDFYIDGHSGLRDGVLLIPGAEMKGLLVYPTMSLRPYANAEPAELAPLVRNRGGHVFLSHLEERMDWELPALTGVEIYNTHADFKKQKRLIESLKNPLWLIKVSELIREYPQEVFTALQSYPDDYLTRWDTLCQSYPHAGVAANDAHQNIGVRLQLGERDQVVVMDALGEELASLPRLLVASMLTIPADAQSGDTVFQLQLDPYENSLRHVGTHLLVTEVTREGVWQALDSGRTFVAFDGLADSRGFEFRLEDSAPDNTDTVSKLIFHELGSHVPAHSGMRWVGQSPLDAQWKLIRNGTPIHSWTGSSFEFPCHEPGVYRVELWLNVDGEARIWILSSPIYITPS